MTSEFRDAIASVIDGWEPSGLPLEDCADRILAMPEMQAIRSVLQRECFDLEDRLPQYVTDWAMKRKEHRHV